MDVLAENSTKHSLLNCIDIDQPIWNGLHSRNRPSSPPLSVLRVSWLSRRLFLDLTDWTPLISDFASNYQLPAMSFTVPHKNTGPDVLDTVLLATDVLQESLRCSVLSQFLLVDADSGFAIHRAISRLLNTAVVSNVV